MRRVLQVLGSANWTALLPWEGALAEAEVCVCSGAGAGDAHRIYKEQILLPPPVLQPVSSSPCWHSSHFWPPITARLSTDPALHFQKVLECCASHRESSLLGGFVP